MDEPAKATPGSRVTVLVDGLRVRNLPSTSAPVLKTLAMGDSITISHNILLPVPVVVDGVIALAALLAAEAMVPGVKDWCVAGHRSVEPGASAALAHLGLTPVLDLGLRLGEGTGAVLALPVVQAAARVLREMATFDAAGVTDKDC